MIPESDNSERQMEAAEELEPELGQFRLMWPNLPHFQHLVFSRSLLTEPREVFPPTLPLYGVRFPNFFLGACPFLKAGGGLRFLKFPFDSDFW